MDQLSAIEIARASRPRFEVPPEFHAATAEKRLIEVVNDGQPVRDALPLAGPVRDALAWVVTLSHDASTVEFAIDDASGNVLRFRRSRSAMPYFEK